jgi:hypothetical protein
MTHVYRWKKFHHALFGLRCRVVARGKRNSLLVEFADGTRHVVSRFAVRRIK